MGVGTEFVPAPFDTQMYQSGQGDQRHARFRRNQFGTKIHRTSGQFRTKIHRTSGQEIIHFSDVYVCATKRFFFFKLRTFFHRARVNFSF